MTFTDILVKAEALFAQVSVYLNVVVIALAILLGGFIIGKVIESIMRASLSRIGFDDRLARMFGARRNYARATRRTVVRLIYLAAVLLALDRLSLMRPVLIVTLCLAVVVVIISLVLAGLDVIPNIAARADLRGKGIVVGDDVVYADQNGVVHGTIIDMTLTDIRIRRANGDIFFIPNSAFLNRSVTKKRKTDTHRHHA